MRPYPSVDRALNQVTRSRRRSVHVVDRRPDGIIDEKHVFPVDAFARFYLNALRPLAPVLTSQV